VTLPNVLVQSKGDVQGVLDRLGIRTQTPFELIPAVLPVISFERPTPTAEKLAWGRLTAGPEALEFSYNGLFNPANSGTLIHVDSAIVTSSATGQVIAGQVDTQFSSASTNKNFRDRRLPGIPVGIIAQQTDLLNTLITGEAQLQTLASTPFLLPFDCYLGEGEGVGVGLLGINRQLISTWYWEELRPQEL